MSWHPVLSVVSAGIIGSSAGNGQSRSVQERSHLYRIASFGSVYDCRFFVLNPLIDMGMAALHLHGISTFNLDSIWPGITDRPLTSFLLYSGSTGFFRLLAPPGGASLQLVVEFAQPASQLAEHESVER